MLFIFSLSIRLGPTNNCVYIVAHTGTAILLQGLLQCSPLRAPASTQLFPFTSEGSLNFTIRGPGRRFVNARQIYPYTTTAATIDII